MALVLLTLTLGRFATAWLLAVLLFFSLCASKLHSYWLVALAPALSPPKILGRALACSAGGLLLIGAALAAAPLWLNWIADPSLPGLRAALGAGTWFSLGAGILLLAALPLAGLAAPSPSRRLLLSQLALVPLVPAPLLPVWGIGDQWQGTPVRALATVAASQRSDSEPLAMVGLRKPSLHCYSRATVPVEGRSPEALVNLADRLRHKSRPGLRPAPPERQPRLLVVIDAETAERAHWRDWRGQELARAEPYRLWRLDRRRLEGRAQSLRAEVHRPTWREPRPERF